MLESSTTLTRVIAFRFYLIELERIFPKRGHLKSADAPLDWITPSPRRIVYVYTYTISFTPLGTYNFRDQYL